MKLLYLIFPIFSLLAINDLKAQIFGCTDPMATNFNPSATNNDGSCTYIEASIAPESSFDLSDNIKETSGLIKWHDQIWTFNDNDDINIYSLDTINGNILNTYALSNTINIDWEEISQDDDYVYIGDFGNNVNGNRTDLKILRIDKNSILVNSTLIDTINFSYSNQDDFSPSGADNTDFDCESFIVSADSIFLFTKQWVSNKTNLYAVSKTPGTYIANLKSTLNVNGMITGAVYLESKKLIVLCGYSNLLQPFIYLLYDFNGSDFFNGNKRKITVSLPFHQVEGIASTNGLKYYISNEYFTQPPFITTSQKLHILDLSSFLSNFINSITSVTDTQTRNDFSIFPVLANDFITLKTDDGLLPVNYFFTNQSGQIVLTGILTKENPIISISDLSVGVYILNIGAENKKSFKVIKR
jgi:hypothetical protein